MSPDAKSQESFMLLWYHRTCLAFIIVAVLWMVGMGCLSASVNANPEWWEALTTKWGYAHFRDWGDQFFFISIGGAVAFFFVVWGLIEIIYAVWPKKRYDLRRYHLD